MSKISTVETMTFDGGADCLDFVNSGYDLEKDVVVEKLHSYGDLLVLSGRMGFLQAAVLDKLRSAAEANPAAAEEAMVSASEIRGLLYRVFAGLASEPPKYPQVDQLGKLNLLFHQALRFRKAGLHDGRLSFSFQADPADLMAPVWHFLLSAYDLLHAQQPLYIKQCQGCAWVFLDQTKNHGKKWCKMEPCGNRQKTRRYYQSKKQA